MECILHIGLPKTGTTSLQAALSENRESLLRHGVVYPETGLNGNGKHKGLLNAVLTDVDTERFGMPKDWVERFKEETSFAKICVLSCEKFSRIEVPEAISSLIPRERTRVVMYVREPVAHVVSIYRNRVKNQNMTMSLQEFAESYRLPYLSVAERWAAVFGSENIVIRRYGRDFGRWDIVSDFANLIGLERDDAFPRLPYELNPGISGNLLFITRVLNCFYSHEQWPFPAIGMKKFSHLDDRYHGPIPVDQETVDLISLRAWETLEGLEKNFGISIKPREKPIEAPPCPDYGKLAQDFARILSSARESNSELARHLELMANTFSSVGAFPNR